MAGREEEKHVLSIGVSYDGEEKEFSEHSRYADIICYNQYYRKVSGIF
ncbi:hypothetical protein [Pelistega suis]|uniref:Uncharacterized protein n=1 Tax=Pelistega suis TaxID=1631957 RepID=A0A849P7W0_9BURK|nr:hypothetical protein [Pelistega suis]NOL51628.1 hypothetical protein [Pelistega suis]